MLNEPLSSFAAARARRLLLASLLLPSCSAGQATEEHADTLASDAATTTRPSAHLALAATLPKQCGGKEIFRIQRPVSTDDPTLGVFSYAFRFKAPTTAGAPVLVYLPGGPGMTSTDTVPDFVPSGWGYLLTDPRGVGCNTFATVPAPTVSGALFRTVEIARDVVAAIGDRQLDKYVLYGVSYGTLLGTVVAFDLEQKGVKPPIAVIHEGVLGRAWNPGEFTASEAIQRWDETRLAMPTDVVTKLDTQPSPYGLTPDQWSEALNSILLGGTDIITLLFDALSADSPTSLQDEALTNIRAYDMPELTEPGAVEMYRQVACREIHDTAPSSNLDPIFSHGQMVRNLAQEGTKCAGLHVTTPYDSADYQFTAMAYDFIGDSDIATPPWQGNYHYDNHKGHAVRVVTKGGGHVSLQLDQSLCASDVIASIGAGGSDLADVLLTCPDAVTVSRK